MKHLLLTIILSLFLHNCSNDSCVCCNEEANESILGSWSCNEFVVQFSNNDSLTLFRDGNQTSINGVYNIVEDTVVMNFECIKHCI